MRFTFLGTSAAEFYPALFCRCDNCEKARSLGGKNIRTFSSAYLEPDCMIDFNASSVLQARRYGVPIAGIRHLLVTHSHDDHLSTHQLLFGRFRKPEHAGLDAEERMLFVGPRFSDIQTLHVYGTPTICSRFERDGVEPDPAVYGIAFHRLGYGESFDAGDMRCTALEARHTDGPDSRGLNYIVERRGRTILYALDTGWFPEQSLEEISRHRFDLVVLEATFGLGAGLPDSHMNLSSVEKAFSFFVDNGLLAEGAKFTLSHMSPHWTPVHDELAPAMKERGITVAYDGMSLEL